MRQHKLLLPFLFLIFSTLTSTQKIKCGKVRYDGKSICYDEDSHSIKACICQIFPDRFFVENSYVQKFLDDGTYNIYKTGRVCMPGSAPSPENTIDSEIDSEIESKLRKLIRKFEKKHMSRD